MKIEFTKEDIQDIERGLRDFLSDASCTPDMIPLYNRIKDMASWPQVEYDRIEREQSRVMHAGAQALYPIKPEFIDMIDPRKL